MCINTEVCQQFKSTIDKYFIGDQRHQKKKKKKKKKIKDQEIQLPLKTACLSTVEPLLYDPIVGHITIGK